MRRAMVAVLVFLSALWMSCNEENGVGPTPEPPGTQQDIPWPSLADSPWPMHHGNPQSTGRSKVSAAPAGVIVWEYETEGQILSSPAIGPDGTIYFVTSYDVSTGPKLKLFLEALDQSGRSKWRFQLLEDTTKDVFAFGDVSPSVVADGTVYVGTAEGNLFAIHPDGSLKWKYRAGGSIFNLGLAVGLDGTIYFVANDGNVYAVAPDGALRWKRIFGGGLNYSAGVSLTISPDGTTIYVPGAPSEGSNTLYALDLSGVERWSFNTGGRLYSSALVTSDGDIFIAPESPLVTDTTGAIVYLLDSEGQLIWRDVYYYVDYPMGVDAAIDYDGNIYFPGHEGDLVSLTYDGKRRWQLKLGDSIGSSIVCDKDGTIYFGSAYGNFFYAVRSDGVIRWKFPLNGNRVYNSPAIGTDGTIYLPIFHAIQGASGKIIAVR